MNSLTQFLVDGILLEGIEKTIVVYSGRFQPFHKGHFATYENLIKKFGKDNVYIATSNKTDNQKSPFNFKEKKLIMQKMFGIPSNKIVEVRNPYAPMEILANYPEETTGFITVVGEKDEMRLSGKYFTPYKGKVEMGYKDKGYVYASPAQPNAISGTDVRKWLGSGETEERKKLFIKVYPKFDEQIFKLITLKLNKLSEEVLSEVAGTGGVESDGEPDSGYSPDGTLRIIDRGKPEPWLKQLGMKQIDKPRADAMRGKGRTKDKESQFRKLYYKVQNIKGTDLDPAKQPHKVEDWENVESGKKVKKIKRFWEARENEKDEKHPKQQPQPYGLGFDFDSVGEPSPYLSQPKSPNTPNAGALGGIAKALDKDSNIGIAQKDMKKNWAQKHATIKGPVKPFKEAITSKNHPAETEAEKNFLQHHKTSTYAPDYGYPAELDTIDFDDKREKQAGHQVGGKDTENRGYEPMKKEDKIPGGLAKGMTLNDIAKKHNISVDTIVKDLKKGMKVEMEHTTDVNIAKEIAFDHLYEDPKYYDKLAKIETPKNEAFTKGQIFAGKMKVGGKPVNVEVELVGADDKTKQFITRIIYADKGYEKQLPIGSTLPIPARIFRTPGGGWRKIKTPSVFEMAKADMDAVEKYADAQMSPEDIELGKETDHFFQRLNDPRNGKEISPAELTGFFKRLAKNKKKFLEFLKQYREFVVKDNRSNINIAFIKVANKLIAKTVMRKADFKSATPIFTTETINELTHNEKSIRDGNPNNVYYAFYKGQFEALYSAMGGVGLTDYYWDKFKVRKPAGAKFKLNPELIVIPKKEYDRNPGHYSKLRPHVDKLWNDLRRESINESLLLEGGAYGHMNHPFDVQMNLTFGDLKNIVKKALSGKLELAREKTDGQALAISWINGRLVAARNKSHLKNKGKDAMGVQDVISKFAGRGSVSDAFSFAIKDLESAIKGLSDKDKKDIFKDGKCFMNCEIIYPENTNVVPYGTSLLVFHGTMEYNEAGDAVGENPASGAKLAAMIKQINAHVQSKFTLQGPPVQKLPVNKDLKAKQPVYLGMISKLQSEFGLSDKNGVADYHQAWWRQFVDKNASSLDEQQKIGLVKRWAFGDKSFRLADIKDAKLKAWADQTDKKDQAKITKDNLLKFEEIFLGVGADVLSFMTSVLTANPEAAKQQMVGRLETAISSIKATGDAKNLAKLEIELARLNALGGFDKIVPNEGIVFSYKGATYKLTGAFAPLNQILGIFTFSR